MNLTLAQKKLESQNTDEILSALASFGREGKLSHLPVILPFVKNPKPPVKKAAIEACCELIRNNLLEHFHELSDDTRKKLGVMMESLDPLIIDEISKDLYCDNEQRRLRSVQILGLLSKNPKLKELLAKLIKDKNEKIRATAVAILGKMVDIYDYDTIIALLHDNDNRVRANTVEALETTGNKRLVPVLQRFRKDPNNRIRGNVLKALYNLGYKEIIYDLIDMLSSRNDFMKASALWVISQTKICTTELEDYAAYNLLSHNEMVRNNARKALKSLGTPRASGYLKYLDIEESNK